MFCFVFNKNKTALNEIIHRTGSWSDLTEADYALGLLPWVMHGSVNTIPSALPMCTGVLVIPQTQKTSENHGEGNEVPTSVGCWQRKAWGRAGIIANTSVLPPAKADMETQGGLGLFTQLREREAVFFRSLRVLKADTSHPSSPPGRCPQGAHKGVRANRQWRPQALLLPRDWYWRPHVAGSGTALGRTQTLTQRDSLL